MASISLKNLPTTHSRNILHDLETQREYLFYAFRHFENITQNSYSRNVFLYYLNHQGEEVVVKKQYGPSKNGSKTLSSNLSLTIFCVIKSVENFTTQLQFIHFAVCQVSLWSFG